MDIDTADHVKHGPSGETWVVAYVEDDRLAWCGWPEREHDDQQHRRRELHGDR